MSSSPTVVLFNPALVQLPAYVLRRIIANKLWIIFPRSKYNHISRVRVSLFIALFTTLGILYDDNLIVRFWAPQVENYVVTINRSSRTFLHFIYMCAEDVTDKWLYLEFTGKNR